MKNRLLLPTLFSFLFAFSLTAQTVVDIVVNSENHNTLETAVLAANLAETLSSDGPFTVFAPTDAAFAAIDADVLNSLLADPQGALTDVLLNHVVSGVADGSNISDGLAISSLLGQNLRFAINGDGIFINNIKVSVADIKASNGVVHVIDAVLVPTPAAPPVPETVVDIITGSEVHTTLASLVGAAQLADDLSSEGPFTVFAPTDAAFAALPAELVAALTADPTGALADVLLYHATSGVASTSNIMDGTIIGNLAGENISFTINDNGVFVNNVQVTVADLHAENGVVHVIDAVLIPPPPVPETVVDIITSSEVHTTLASLVGAAQLADDLSSEGPFTVFAPTDAAFAALPAELVAALTADPTGALADVLLYHATSGVASTSNIMDGTVVSNLAGQNLNFTVNDNGVFVNNIQVSVADLHAKNGVVHVIDAILLPPTPSTVMDVIVNSPDHTQLEALIMAAGLEDALRGDGPFTVFAPTDAAIAKLPADVVASLTADPTGALANVLLYHVLSGVAKAENLSDGLKYSTLLGTNLTVSINANGVFINDSQVTVADIHTDNGVVHVIDTVLVP